MAANSSKGHNYTSHNYLDDLPGIARDDGGELVEVDRRRPVGIERLHEAADVRLWCTRLDMCLDLCFDMCLDMCLEMCLDMNHMFRLSRHVSEHVPRHVFRHMFRHVLRANLIKYDSGIFGPTNAQRVLKNRDSDVFRGGCSRGVCGL